MTVIVKGMDMPQDCFECDFQNPFVEEPYCRRLLKRCPKTRRLEDCPLGEVLTPHGRLIDVDKADKYAYDELELANGYRTGWEAARAMQKIYQSVPTVIEAEEK